MRHQDHEMMNYMGWGGMLMLLLVILVIGAIVYFIVKVTRKEAASKNETPLEILKIRYAKGEISKEEFDAMKTDM